MNFQPELAAKVLDGTKTVTRRLTSTNARSPWYVERCGIREGRDYAVCPGRGKHATGRLVVTSVRRETLGHLTDEEARAEGFASRKAFEDAFVAINDSFDPQALVWRIEFRRAVVLLHGPFDGRLVPEPSERTLTCEGDGVPEGMVARYRRQRDAGLVYRFHGYDRIVGRVALAGGAHA